MSIQVCRTAVKTNYFPLWEAENGKIRFTHEVSHPEPVSNLTKLMRKFSHLNEGELAELQKEIDDNFAILKHLAAI